jgi:hypothetical protein
MLRPPLWSSGQSSWLQTQIFRVWFPALPDFLRRSGSGTESTQPRENKWGDTWMKSSGSLIIGDENDPESAYGVCSHLVLGSIWRSPFVLRGVHKSVPPSLVIVPESSLQPLLAVNNNALKNKGKTQCYHDGFRLGMTPWPDPQCAKVKYIRHNAWLKLLSAVM